MDDSTLWEQYYQDNPGAEPVTSVAFRGKMTYEYGDNKRSDVTAATTFDAILKSERTATTRYESQGNLDYWKKAKIGDIITWESGDGRTVDVIVTKALAPLKGSGKTAEQWSKLEGWSVEYFNKNVKPKLDEAWQLEYKLAAPSQPSTQPSTGVDKVLEGDIFALPGIPVITTNLGGVHGAGLAAAAKAKGLIQQSDGLFKATDKVVQLPVKLKWSDNMSMNNNMILLNDSLNGLVNVAKANPSKTYLLPLAGLGHGEGKVEEIMPMLISTLQSADNIKLVIPAEGVSLGRQGTVRKDTTREKMPQIKSMLQEAGLLPKSVEKETKVSETKENTITLKDGKTYTYDQVNAHMLSAMRYTPEEIGQLLKELCK